MSQKLIPINVVERGTGCVRELITSKDILRKGRVREKRNEKQRPTWRSSFLLRPKVSWILSENFRDNGGLMWMLATSAFPHRSHLLSNYLLPVPINSLGRKFKNLVASIEIQFTLSPTFSNGDSEYNIS